MTITIGAVIPNKTDITRDLLLNMSLYSVKRIKILSIPIPITSKQPKVNKTIKSDIEEKIIKISNKINNNRYNANDMYTNTLEVNINNLKIKNTKTKTNN